jgi:hypothetical protein
VVVRIFSQFTSKSTSLQACNRDSRSDEMWIVIIHHFSLSDAVGEAPVGILPENG